VAPDDFAEVETLGIDATQRDEVHAHVRGPYHRGMTSPVGDVDSAADWMAQSFTSSGYLADLSLHSLKEVDRFFDDQVNRGTPLTER
jgi:hypothetical protein